MKIKNAVRLVILLVLCLILMLYFYKPWVDQQPKHSNNIINNLPDSVIIVIPESQTPYNKKMEDTAVVIPRTEINIRKAQESLININFYTIPMDSILDMVFVEGGEYKKTEYNWHLNKQPDTVLTTTDTFFIGRYEVTQKIFVQFIKSKKVIINPQYPVGTITMYDVIKFCNAVNKVANLPDSYDNKGNLLDSNGEITTDIKKVKGYRLPTANEWEFAARGGNRTKHYIYSGSNTRNEVAWWQGNSTVDGSFVVHAVGLKKPNELGIYDMSGNANELCNDLCSKSSTITLKTGVDTEKSISSKSSWKLRVLCGGAISNFAEIDCKFCNDNMATIPDQMGNFPSEGFRIARSK